MIKTLRKPAREFESEYTCLNALRKGNGITKASAVVMGLGNIMNVGYEKVYLMQNDMTTNVSEVISTYVYKIGLVNAQFSFSTAIGLMNNVVNFIVLVIANTTANKIFGSGLW